MAELRSFIFIDQLQPRTMCYPGSWIKGRISRSGMAAQFIEVAPGLDIEPLSDVAGAAANEAEKAAPGITIVTASMIDTAGRLYLGGTTEQVLTGRDAITSILTSIGGRAG